MIKITLSKALLVLLLLLLALSSSCKSLEEKIVRYLDAAHQNWKFEGTVLIAYHGKVVFSRGYGYANQEIGRSNTTRTKFFIGSITKQFTAAAILKLQEDGLLDVSDPISHYLPDYPKPNADKITIHHLLTHGSGIPDYLSNPEILLRRTREIEIDNLMKAIINEKLLFEPGTGFSYSNSNYIILGAIIEKVSGQSYEAYLHNKIFKPAGMLNSGYARREAGLPDRADGYTIEEHGKLLEALPVHFSILHTAGALYSTVEDMLKWDRALYDDKILTSGSVKAMLTPYTNGYGYGWVIENKYGRVHAFHGGFVDGYNCTFDRWLDDELCVVVFSNEDEAPVKKIARGLAAIAFGMDYVFPIRKTPIDNEHIDPGQYAGIYRIDDNLYRYVTQENDSLYTNLLAQPRQLLLPQAPDTFYFMLDNTELLFFVRNDHGDIIECFFEDDLGAIKAELLDRSISDSLMNAKKEIVLPLGISKKYVGIYQLESEFADSNLNFTLEIMYAGGKLIAGVMGEDFVEMFPASQTEFFHRVADFRIEFILDINSEVTGCIIKMGGDDIYGRKIR